jgi:hypothetical protein
MTLNGLNTNQAGALAKAVTDDTKGCSMPGSFAQGVDDA